MNIGVPCASSLAFVPFGDVVAELDCATAVEATVLGFVLDGGTVGVGGHTSAEANQEAFFTCGGRRREGAEEGQGRRLRYCHYKKSLIDVVGRG